MAERDIPAKRKKFNDSMAYALKTGELKAIGNGWAIGKLSMIETESFLQWLEERWPWHRNVLEHGHAWIISLSGTGIIMGHHAYTEQELDCLRSQFANTDKFLENWLGPAFLELGVAHEEALAKIERLETQNAELQADVTRLRPIVSKFQEANKQRGKTVSLRRCLTHSKTKR